MSQIGDDRGRGMLILPCSQQNKSGGKERGVKSIHVAGKGYLEGERSSGIEAMGRRWNLQINVRTGIMEHFDVNT